MRTTTNINFYCRRCKANKDFEAPIEVSIGINGQRKFFTCSLKCDYRIWGTKKQPEAVSRYVKAMKSNVQNSIAEMAVQGIPLTAEGLKRCIQKGGVNSYTLEDLYSDFNRLLIIRLKNGKITKRTYDKYLYIENLFSKYFSSDRQVSDISPSIIETFYTKLQGIYQDSSLCCMITKLKSIVRFALDNNHLKINPFQNIRVSKGVKEIYTITEEEMNRIKATVFPSNIQKIADIFLFSCASGLSYCDVCALKKEDYSEINGKTCIFKKRQKTKIPFYSVLMPWGVDIAKKYDYDFGKIISNQKVNKNLKKIAKICNITSVKSLHFHLARHFYATYLINKKVPISSISKAMGHSNNSTITLHYARLLTDTIISDIGAVI